MWKHPPRRNPFERLQWRHRPNRKWPRLGLMHPRKNLLLNWKLNHLPPPLRKQWLPAWLGKPPCPAVQHRHRRLRPRNRKRCQGHSQVLTRRKNLKMKTDSLLNKSKQRKRHMPVLFDFAEASNEACNNSYISITIIFSTFSNYGMHVACSDIYIWSFWYVLNVDDLFVILQHIDIAKETLGRGDSFLGSCWWLYHSSNLVLRKGLPKGDQGSGECGIPLQLSPYSKLTIHPCAWMCMHGMHGMHELYMCTSLICIPILRMDGSKHIWRTWYCTCLDSFIHAKY